MRLGVIFGLALALAPFGRPASTLAPAAPAYPSPVDLAVSSDGKRLYVVCEGTGELLAIDTVTRLVAGRVPVGRVPRGIARVLLVRPAHGPSGGRYSTGTVASSSGSSCTACRAGCRSCIRRAAAAPRDPQARAGHRATAASAG